jgi:hypothetical protein
MEASKKLQSYFISLQREDQPTAEDILRKVHSLHPCIIESGAKMCISYGLFERRWGVNMVIARVKGGGVEIGNCHL